MAQPVELARGLSFIIRTPAKKAHVYCYAFNLSTGGTGISRGGTVSQPCSPRSSRPMPQQTCGEFLRNKLEVDLRLSQTHLHTYLLSCTLKNTPDIHTQCVNILFLAIMAYFGSIRPHIFGI